MERISLTFILVIPKGLTEKLTGVIPVQLSWFMQKEEFTVVWVCAMGAYHGQVHVSM